MPAARRPAQALVAGARPAYLRDGNSAGTTMLGLELGVIGLIGLVLIVYALFHVIGSNASTLAKALWTVGLVAFPFVGFIVWLFLGPRSAR
jgi:hypothetical protein